MNTRQVLMVILIASACSACSWHVGQWSLGSARDAVEKSINDSIKPTKIKIKPTETKPVSVTIQDQTFC